jgi:hypothetical protein
MTTDSGNVGSNASLVMSEISERFSSSFIAPVSPRIHFRMKLTVGMISILPAKVLNAYLPGSSGSFQTPREPFTTSSP